MSEPWSMSLLSKKRFREIVLVVIGLGIAWLGFGCVTRIREAYEVACATDITDVVTKCRTGIPIDLNFLELLVTVCAVALPTSIAAFLRSIDRQVLREAWRERDPRGFAAHQAEAEKAADLDKHA